MHLQVFLLVFVPCLCVLAQTQAPSPASNSSVVEEGIIKKPVPPGPGPEPPTPPPPKYGWSDKNYEDDDTRSRSPGRYYGDGYGDDRDDNDRSGYGNRKDRYNKDNDRYEKDNDRYSKDNDRYDNDRYNKDNDRYDNDRYDDDEDYDADSYRSSRNKRVPDEYGNMNLYFREPSKHGKNKKYKKMRFPVNRFKPGHFPPLPPLISFFPWLPIFADKLTKQTIIFSPTGGLYIIPPVINFYGKLFSVAELIASGYASLVSSGVPPPPAVNVAPLVQPGAVVGPGIPPANPATGGFVGGVQTKLGAFPPANKGSGSKGSYGY